METLTLEQAELTGYINVWKDTNYRWHYGIYPDGESSVKIPVILESGKKQNEIPMSGHQIRTPSGEFGRISNRL